MLRSSFKWESRHEFVPVEETVPSVEQGSTPQGFQELLVRLVKAVLINKPLCIYQCLATTLEAELDRRTLWEMQFNQYSRSVPSSSLVSLKVPFHLLPSRNREVGDASGILPGDPASRNLTSGSDEQELAFLLECFPHNEKSSLDAKRLKPFLAFELPRADADSTMDEIRVASRSVPQYSTLLAAKAEGLRRLPEDAVSTRASGVMESELGELSKDGTAADDSRVLDSCIENLSPIIPENEFLLRSRNPLAADGDQTEFKDGHKYLLGSWHDNSLQDTALNEEIDCTGQNKTVKSRTRENLLHMLDAKPADADSRGSTLACDSSDRPSYIPRGDRFADAMLHLDAKTSSVQDLESEKDAADMSDTEQYADALNKIFSRFYREPEKSHSGQDSCVVPTTYDAAFTASNPDIAVLHETSETAFPHQDAVHTTLQQVSNVVRSSNDLADAVCSDDGRVMVDEQQTTYPENSSQDQDVPHSYLTRDTAEKCLELVTALEKQEYRNLSFLDSTETDELEYLTPPNESFRREEFQEEDEFHTPRAIFPCDALVTAGNEEMSAMSVHDLRDNPLLASRHSEPDEELTAESGIQQFPQSNHNQSTQSEGLRTEFVHEGFLPDKEVAHNEENIYESSIYDRPRNDESSQDEELTIEPVVESILHGKESKHDQEITVIDKEMYDESQIQGLSHDDESSQDEELTIEPVVESILHGKESKHDQEITVIDKEMYDESQIQGLSHDDESSQDEELTIEPVVESILHGKESKHDQEITVIDKEMYDESQIQGLSHDDESSQDEELTIEPVVESILHGRESKHDQEITVIDKEMYDESQIQGLSHDDESTQDEELTIESVVESVLPGRESKHDQEITVIDKETYDESQIQELSHNDESTQDEELTTESVVESVLHGKESKHDQEITVIDKETYGESQIQVLSHNDESTQDEELIIESVVEEVLHGKESKHDQEITVIDKETYGESQIQELSHDDESTQDEELTTESVVEEVLHGKESKYKEITDDSVISEIQHGDEPAQDEGLSSESVVEESLHVKQFAEDRETSDESVHPEFQYSDESAKSEELTSEAVVVNVPSIKESTHDKDTSDEALSQEFSPSHGEIEGEGLKFKTEFQEFPHSDKLLQGEQLISDSYSQNFPQDEESAQNEGFASMSASQAFWEIEGSAHGNIWMSKESGEFQSSGGSAHGEDSVQGEDLTSELALQEFPHCRESTCSNEMIANSVRDEETTLDSMQAEKTVNDSTSSRNEVTVSSADETVVQPGSSLEEEMLYEETDMRASLMGEEVMNFETVNDEETSKDSVVSSGQLPQKAVLQEGTTGESMFDEENPALENVEMKMPDIVCSAEIALRTLPDEKMIHQSKLSEEISPGREHTEEIYKPENAEIKSSDSVLRKDIASVSLLLEEIHTKSEHGEMNVSHSDYGKDLTPELLLREVIQPELEHSERRTTDSVCSKLITPQSSHNEDTAAEHFQADTHQSSESITETVKPEAVSVRPVMEPLLYGKSIFTSFSHASESEILGVTNKPTMSEEKAANMLEWDEMNLDRRESDASLHKQDASNENPDLDDTFPDRDEREPSVTESESDTGTGQPSLEVAVDHPDCFSNFSTGPLLGREARIRLKWYSISTSCSDVLEEEDEDDESNIAGSSSRFEDEGARNGQTTLQDDSRYSEELAQNQQEESTALHLTKGEPTNEMVSADDLLGKDVLSEWKNDIETDAAKFPSCANKQALTLEDGDQSLCKSIEVSESSTNSSVVPKNCESLTPISGEDLCVKVYEKEVSASDGLHLSQAFTGETELEKTKEMEDDESDVVKEDQVFDEPNQIKSTWDVDMGDEIQADVTMASGKHWNDETKVGAEKAQVLEDTTDAQMINEVADDTFPAIETEFTEDFSSKAEFIQLMNEAALMAESCEHTCTPDEEAEERKSMLKTDIDDTPCFVETETIGKGIAYAVRTSDMENLEASDGENCKTEETDTKKEDVVTIAATVANFFDEAFDEMSISHETAEEKALIEMPADESQSTVMPVIQRDVKEDADAFRTLDSEQETDEPVAKFTEKSARQTEPEETTSLFESSSNLCHNLPDQNWFDSREGKLHSAEYSTTHFQLTGKDSEEIDTIQEFKKDADSPVTEVAHLDSRKNRGMSAERNYDETIKPEKAVSLFAAAPGQTNFDGEYPHSENKTEEESAAVESRSVEIFPVHPTYMHDTGEDKDEQEFIIIPQKVPIVFSAAPVHGHADVDEPNLIDEGDQFFYVEPDKGQLERHPSFLPAHPQLVAKDSEEMDVIREIKDYGENLSSHPRTRSQWDTSFEEAEIIIPQKVDIYSASPIHKCHNKSDSDSKERVDFPFGEETSTGLSTDEKSSREEDENAVNDRPLDAASENHPTDVFGLPLDAFKSSDETKLNDSIAPSNKSSKSKSCGKNVPVVEHEESSSEWPPLPQFLSPYYDEDDAPMRRSTVYYRDDDAWPGPINRCGSPGSDFSDSDYEEASIYSTEPVTAKRRVADDSVSRQNAPDSSDVAAAEVSESKVADRCDTKSNEVVQASLNARALESEEWPPMPDFALLNNESDGVESRNSAVDEAQSATGATVGATEDRMNVGDLTKASDDDQVMDSSEQWPPLPDFILEELVFGRSKSNLCSILNIFDSGSREESPVSSSECPVVEAEQVGMLRRQGRARIDPFTQETIYGADSCDTDVADKISFSGLLSQTDKDEALSEFLNEDDFDDQKLDKQLELSVVNQLVLEIVSSAKQSVQELVDRESLIAFESAPTEKEITSELLDFGSEGPLPTDVLSGDDQTATSDEFAIDLPDSDFEEASIYWTQPTIAKPPVTDSVSLQSSPDDVATETTPENTWKITGPEDNEAGFEVRQFCAVASSAFTDLTKVTGSQADMKSHHNIQSHIELGVMACQSWSDLDIPPCGSSKSLQLIGAPEMSSWAAAGSDEANRKWREDDQVGRRQVAEADGQSTYTGGEAIRKVMETEDVDSGCKIQATEKPLLGCHRDSASVENERGSRGSSVHIWMPVEEDGLLEDMASKGSGVMSSPMELREKASVHQSSDVPDTLIALEGTVEPSGAVDAESNVVMETVPISAPKDCSTVTESSDEGDRRKESNKVKLNEMPDEFGAALGSTSSLTGKNVSDRKQENVFAGTLDIAEPSGGSNWEIDLNSVTEPQKNDPEVLSGELEEFEQDDVTVTSINEGTPFSENKLQMKISSVEETTSDGFVPAVELDEQMKQTETSSIEPFDPSEISASEAGFLDLESSTTLKELGTEVASDSDNCLQMVQSSAGVPGKLDAYSPKMSDAQEPQISGDLDAPQEAVINSAPANDEMTNLQELLISDCREPNDHLDALNRVSCSLCKTDRTAMAVYPDTAATPLSDLGNWVQMGHTWFVEDEILTSAGPSSRKTELGAEKETTGLSSFSSALTATGDIPVGENRANSPTFETVETVDEEVKLVISTEPESSENDKLGASSESVSTISLTGGNSHLDCSPQVIEVEDGNVGLDQDDWVQDEADEVVFGEQEQHFLPSASAPSEQMENSIFSDATKPRMEHQSGFDTIGEQLDLIQPDNGSPVLQLGDSMEVTRKSEISSTNVNLELIDENVAADVEESDPSFMQTMSFPVSSGTELGSLKTSSLSSQLESEDVDDSKLSASLPWKGEDEGQQKTEEEGLVEEEQQLSVSSSDLHKSSTSELSPTIHCVQDVEPRTESLKWEDKMQDIAAFNIGDENRVASEDSQTFDSDVEKQVDASRQQEDLATVEEVRDLDKDTDSDTDKDCEQGLRAENENNLDDYERGSDKNYDKDQDKNDTEDQDKNCAKDLDGDHNEDQDLNPDVRQDKDHDEDHDDDHTENLDKNLDKDRNEDQDVNQIKDIDMGHCESQDKTQGEVHGTEPSSKGCKEDDEEDRDIGHDHHTGPITTMNKTDSSEDVGKELGLTEVSSTEETDECVQPIPPHSTKSEIDLVFSLHENQAECRIDSDVMEALNEGSASPTVLTGGKDVSIIPVYVLDESPRSKSPSVSPVFLVATQDGGYKVANLEEQNTIGASMTEFEGESQEQNETEQSRSDDVQKTYVGTTSSEADDGTFAFKAAEGIVSSSTGVTSATETDGVKVVSKSDDETFASETTEEISVSKLEETSASETDGDTVASNIRDGTVASKTEVGMVGSEFEGLNASKIDDRTGSSEADEGIAAAAVEANANNEREASKNDDATIEAYDGVVTSEIDSETADDETITF